MTSPTGGSVEELRETLARLHQELRDAQEIDEGLRAELRQALDEISEKIERPEGQGEEPLGEQLEDLAFRFESSHPVLAEMLGQVIRTLSRMGI